MKGLTCSTYKEDAQQISMQEPDVLCVVCLLLCIAVLCQSASQLLLLFCDADHCATTLTRHAGALVQHCRAAVGLKSSLIRQEHT